MAYRRIYADSFKKDTKQLKKKDRVLFERLVNKIDEIMENPERYKHLRNILKGEERVQIGPFVLKFEVVGNDVEFLRFEHHDKAY